ncbi:MAG: Carbamoyl phosphate synthase-like protein [Shouchella clausii]|jgi:carbamoyl-phosphate synthase large subunit
MNILLTSGARRIDFVGFFQEALKKANIEGKVIVADPEYNAPSLQVGDENYVIPHQTDEHYIEAILTICQKHNVDCLVPLNDWEVPKIAAHKKELQEQGVAVFAPDQSVVDSVRDKGNYRQLLSPIGVKAPKSYCSIATVKAALANNQIAFPLMIKPRNGSASIGVETAYKIEDIEHAYHHAVNTVKESPLDDATAKEAENNILIEEIIEGDKYSLDIFNDLDGRFCASFIRKQLQMRGGDVDRCITVHQPELVEIARKMGEHLGHAGYMNADVFFNGDDYYVIDINPRFGGGYAFSHHAGADVPSAIIALTAGKTVKEEWLTTRPNLELARHDIVVPIEKTFSKLHPSR